MIIYLTIAISTMYYLVALFVDEVSRYNYLQMSVDYVVADRVTLT